MIESSVYTQFSLCAKDNLEQLACRFDRKTYTYKELLEQINITASKLLNLGVKKGDVVLVSIPNCVEAVNLFYAVNQIGAISYLVHPLTPPNLLAKYYEKSKAKIIVILGNRYEEISAKFSKDIPIISVNPYYNVNFLKFLSFKKMCTTNKESLYLHKIKSTNYIGEVHQNCDDDAVYLNTGGTNGMPKIVRLSNKAINSLGQKGYPLIGGDVKKIKMLTAIPLFHGFGLVMGIHTPLISGASTVLMIKFRTKEAINYIKKSQSTVIIGVPALYKALLSKDEFYGPWLKNQIVAFVGGDSVSQSLLNQWNDAMYHNDSLARLYEGYGLTETVNVSNVNTSKDHRLRSVGKPLPGLNEIIVEPDTNKVLGFNELGEILISGNTLMTGYLNDEELTNKSFTTIDGKKYIRTKDYGKIDEDGYLYYYQRLRRTVKINGQTICPSNLEKSISSLNFIYECYAFSIKDDKKGAHLRLAAVMNKNYTDLNKEIIQNKIIECIKSNVTFNEYPDYVVFLDKMPRTSVGKIDDKAFEELSKQELNTKNLFFHFDV